MTADASMGVGKGGVFIDCWCECQLAQPPRKSVPAGNQCQGCPDTLTRALHTVTGIPTHPYSLLLYSQQPGNGNSSDVHQRVNG